METVDSRAAAPRLPGLDLVRAAAISWVLVYHGSLFGLTSQDHWLVANGWMGVDLFFVLSGFLIAGQLLRPWAHGSAPSYARFFGRRLLRTLPAYLVVLAIYFLVPGARERPSMAPLWQFLSFSQNWLFEYPIHGLKAFSHVWSLCVEEQFYLVFPAVVALIALRPTPAKVIGAVLCVLILGMALRGYLWLRFVADPPFDIVADPRSGRYMHFIYCPTATRLDGLLMGIVAAAIQTFRPGTWAKLTARPNLLLGAGCLGLILSTFIFQEGSVARFWPAVFGYPFQAFAIMLIVMAGADNRSLIGRYRVPGASALAAGAYSLYLTHKIVFHWVELMRPHLPAALQWAAFSLAIVGALGCGAALYWLVERPFLRLRDRLEGRSRSSLARPATLGETA